MTVIASEGSCRNGHDLSVLGRNKFGQCVACKHIAQVRFRASPAGRVWQSRSTANRSHTQRSQYEASPKGRSTIDRWTASQTGQISHAKARNNYEIRKIERRLNAS